MKEKRVMDKENDSKRTTYFLVIVAFVFGFLILRLCQLQILNGEAYREKAVRNSLKQNVVKATRGKIYDVNGEILADNTTGYKIVHLQTRVMSNLEKKILLEMYKNDRSI